MSSVPTRFARILVAAVVATIIACRNDVGPTELPAAASVETAGGTGQSAEVGEALGVAPAVLVRDSAGRPIRGIEVHFTARRGTIARASARTDDRGIASAGIWRLPERSGLDTIVASVTGVTPLLITAVARPGAAVGMTILNPTGFEARVLEGMDLPVFKVADRFGNGVGGVDVTLGVLDTDGSMPISRAGPATDVTDAFGIVGATSWIPYIVGNHRLAASAANGAFTAVATRHVREDACGARHVIGAGMTRTIDFGPIDRVPGCGNTVDLITVILTAPATITVQADPLPSAPPSTEDVRTASLTRAPAWSVNPQVIVAPTAAAARAQFSVAVNAGNYDIRISAASQQSRVQVTVTPTAGPTFARSR